MPTDVSDVRSNPQDQIAHAATVIGRSKDCRKVFSEIYRGKKAIKTATEIAQSVSLPRLRVLQEAGKLANNSIVKKTKINNEIAYEKDPFFTQNKKKILRLAGNKKALAEFPTKTNPRFREMTLNVRLPKQFVDVEKITIDDIDSFSKVRSIEGRITILPVDERKFKEGLQKILNEQGTFNDWGGELNDLFSTRLILRGERKDVAFGLKGKGMTGPLTPKKMGHQGDQVQRLFRTPAEIFIVQYWNKIDESIVEQLKNFAVAKSALEGKKVYYGIIDGQDTMRIIAAYPECFAENTLQE
jgi:hypothetical protein